MVIMNRARSHHTWQEVAVFERLTDGRALESILFFFSSRGRHTRWNCDWSSDVCSSDLTDPVEIGRHNNGFHVLFCQWRYQTLRSEERRVGKECRFRGSPYRRHNEVD